ncbi:hypothetical protein [uncultured Phascolarctobacterium sp.]|uniref:hypothetical protein n=1 Tax=Phascolarctobacterium sp. TaxID=2049039 RepID=UPI0025E4F5FF|nr:hypothetical protein [uncultured Phascolarctobacterium sp.]
MNIGIFANQLSLFIYLLLENEEKLQNTVYIFDETFKYEIVKKVKSYKCKCFYFRFNTIPNVFRKIFYKVFFERLRIYLRIMYKNERNIEIFGQDHLRESSIFFSDEFKDIKFNLIEDGSANYWKRNIVEEHSKPFNYLIVGHSDRINKIYLTGLFPTPKEIKHKVSIIDMEYLWNQKSDSEKKIIKDWFGIDKDIIKNLKSKSNCLLTQCFYDNGDLSREKQINLYKKILDGYSYKDTFIKVHPLDTLPYSTIFPEYTIVNGNIPFELIYLLTNNFKKILTVNSSGIGIANKKATVEYYNYNGVKVDIMAGINEIFEVD